MSFAEVNAYTTYSLLALAVSLSGLVLVRCRFGIDKAMLFMILTTVVAFAFKLFPVIFPQLKWMNFFKPLSEAISQGILYFFVFEMMTLRNKLVSDTQEAFNARERRVTVYKWLVYGVLISIDAIVGSLYKFFQDGYPQ